MTRASVRRVHQHTFAQYIELEKFSNVKHEFLDGDILAMGGGTPTHAELAMTIGSLLLAQLRGRSCRVFSSDLRVRVRATGLATYPDVTVVCGDLQLDPQNEDTVTNPRVVVEVLSDSTERYDRGVKMQHYRKIPTLGAVLLVSQHGPRIELWARGSDDAWTATTSGPGEVATIAAIDCRLRIDDVYA